MSLHAPPFSQGLELHARSSVVGLSPGLLAVNNFLFFKIKIISSVV